MQRLFDNKFPLARMQPPSITITTSTSEVVAYPAPQSDRSIYVTDIAVYNTSAAPTSLAVKDGPSGAVLFRIPAPATGGNTHTFHTPLKLSPGKSLIVQGADSVTSLLVNVIGQVEQ